jgi:hypothetical protein
VPDDPVSRDTTGALVSRHEMTASTTSAALDGDLR